MAKEQYSELIEILHECMKACNHCYEACLKEDDVKMMAECIRTDRECADFCGYFAQALSRNTAFVSELAKVCAEICEACANECKEHDHDHCQKCAEICFKCAATCRKVA